MSNILILNGHQPSDYSAGKLNATFVETISSQLSAAGHDIRVTRVAEGYDIDQEIASHQWADIVIMQFPINWMSMPWSFKKYMDEVYTSGMDGRLAVGDGRSHDNPGANYGLGGALSNTHYMLSVTLNAPANAFENLEETFFAGMSLDDLLAPIHLTVRFLGMTPLKSFAAYDVIKNADITGDLKRLETHLQATIPAVLKKEIA